VHGLGTSSSTWLKLYPFFLQNYSIIALDLAGFGFSTTPQDIPFFSLQEHAASLHAVTAHLGLPPFTLVGHSMGGWVAAKYAAAHPEQVRRLVLINTAGVYVEGTEELRKIFNIRTTADVSRLVHAMWFRYPWYFRLFLPALRSDLIKRRVPDLVQSVHREDFLDDELKKLTMPVHLMWGREDRLLSAGSVREIERLVKQLSVDYIEGCGHVPQLERPEELLKIFEKVMAREEKL
jgi:pimeloyl-ACP methyl ester carboxylesterase